MELRLELDILTQPDDSSCGPTCLHAVYRYLGNPISLEGVLASAERLEDGGTLAVLLGYDALKRGYDATIYTYNLQVFDPSWRELGVEELTRKLEQQAELKTDKKLRAATRAYCRFLQAGGRVRFEDLNTTLIRRILARGVPVLTGLSSTYLYRTRRELEQGGRLISDDVLGHPMGHFVLLTGYDRTSRMILIADPWGIDETYPKSGRYWIGADRVLNAILLGIITYDANLLVVVPRKEKTAKSASAHRRP